MWWSHFVVQAGFKHKSSCFSLWSSKVTRVYYHGNYICTKNVRPGALPLVHLLYCSLRTIPQACEYGYFKCVGFFLFGCLVVWLFGFWGTWQLWGLSLSGGVSQACQSLIFDSKLSQCLLLEKSLWEWSSWNQLTMREETARLCGARLTSSPTLRLLLNFSWTEHEANANGHIQVLLGAGHSALPDHQALADTSSLRKRRNIFLEWSSAQPHTIAASSLQVCLYFLIHGHLTLRNS